MITLTTLGALNSKNEFFGQIQDEEIYFRSNSYQRVGRIHIAYSD